MTDWWVRQSNGTSTIGLTDEALHQLGCIWQWIPRVKKGDNVMKGQGIATIQTTVSLKSLTSPVSGKISKVHYTDRANCISSKQELFSVETDALSGL